MFFANVRQNRLEFAEHRQNGLAARRGEVILGGMFRFLRPFLLLACALALSACVSGKPYVDTLDESHFHLFHRPDFKNPADQWDHVLALAAAGKEKAAAKQAYALRITWPEARHAAEA